MSFLSSCTWTAPSPSNAVLELMESSENLLHLLLSGEKKNENFKTLSSLFIVFPGNPCITQCYQDFTNCLKRDGEVDVLVLGYAGHTIKPYNENKLFSLQEQIQLCDSFLRKLFSPNTSVSSRYQGNIYFVGHSIGAYISLHMLARFQSHVKLFFGLAPVLTFIKESPNGRKFAVMDNIPVLSDAVALLVSAIAIVPKCFRGWMTSFYAQQLDPDLRRYLVAHFRRSQLHNILFMLKDEMRMVRDPDWALLSALQDKMVLYYVTGDGWAPRTHAMELRKGCPNLAGFIEEDEAAGVPHAWCLAHSKIVVQHAVVPFLKKQE